MEEKHRSVKNLPADTSKANPGSQKAVPVNAWLLAKGSYKRPKPLLINLNKPSCSNDYHGRHPKQACKLEGPQSLKRTMIIVKVANWKVRSATITGHQQPVWT